MLKTLRLKNFQCHGDMEVELDPRITAITGPSDAGKSSLLRALRWVCFNKPKGDSFVKEGERGCKVGVRLDKTVVVREKGTGINLYRAGGKTYKSFGTDVPEPVNRLLGISQESFASQHEPLFWFCLTAGEVAKRLNAIVDLSLIDEVSSRLASRLRKAKTEMEVVGERLEAADREVKSLDYVEGADSALVKVESLEVEMAKKDVRLGTLVSLVESAKELASRAETEVPDLSLLDDVLLRIKLSEDRSAGLGELLEEIGVRDNQYNRVKSRLNDAEKLLDEEMGGRCPLCGAEMKGDQDEIIIR